MGWEMLRAQAAEARTVELAQTQHRNADGSTEAPRAPPRTSPPTSLFWAGVSVLTAFALAYLTDQQESASARLIVSSTAAYTALYALLRATGLFQPAAGTISPGEMAEWRSRVGSTINAVVLIYGSLLCFSEWPYAGAEGFVSAHLWSHPVTFASIFAGYLHFDLCWVLWHQRSTPDVASIVHHSMFIAITHYVLWGWYFKQPYAWLSFAELSTPFLNGRWFLAVLGRKSGAAYTAMSLAFALTFLLTRVVGYSLGLYDLWMNYALWQNAKVGLKVVVAGCHMGLALNLFWSRAVVGALVKAVTGGGSDAKTPGVAFSPSKAKAA